MGNLKAIIDSFVDLELIVSGSSSLDLYKGTSDLQRRIYKIDLFPLNFVEYLEYEQKVQLPYIHLKKSLIIIKKYLMI